MTSNDFTLSLELAKRTVALVLAGGRGSRLMQLTDHRVKPAVYFGGKFRIIDFALSNCLNSGIRRIGVVTQYKSHSLLRHLQRGWSFLKPQMNEFVDLLPAQQRINEESWYRGTADAVYQNEDIVKSYRAKYVVILAGDHVYKMDYSVMLADHVASGAECTVGCIEVLHEEASGFGVMAVDASGRITDFVEKPLQPPTMPGRTEVSLASMGIYVFNADYLFRELACDLADENSEHDFGRNIIPRAVQQGKARAHHFRHSCVGLCNEAYWRDVGTVDAYWDANIDLTAAEPRLDLYDQHWPILTYQPQRPPARFVGVGSATESLVSGGCIVAGRVRQSLVSSSVQIQSSAQVNHSVLLPYVELGRGVRVSHAVVDRGCVIPDGMVIGQDPAEDARRFHRTERGIVLVTREMLART